MRVLCIDESPAMRERLNTILRQMGFQVEVAASGVEAMVLLEERKLPDVALIDWNMTETDGLELVKEIRADARWSDICLLMLTSTAVISEMIEALDAGVREVVMKPFTARDLIDKLKISGLIDG